MKISDLLEASDTTLKNYIKQSSGDATHRQNVVNYSNGKKDPKINKRNAGQAAAQRKLDAISTVGEAASAGATSSGNIATVANPHLSPGSARGKKSYTGSPGKSGTTAPPQPKPTQQSPTDNALNMKGTSIFGGPAIKR